MRRTHARITIIAMAGASLAVASSAYALSLGEIDVQSNLNQHFVASIPLTEISSEDLETVSVTLGSNEAYDRAGLERADFLSTLSFQIKNDKGRPRVVVNSTQVAKEPVLNLLVQARWSGGKIVRDYTILLDPPASVAPRPAVSAPPAVQRPAPMPAKPLAPAAKPAPAPVIAAAAPARPASPPIRSSDEFYTAPSETKPAVARPATKSQMPALTDPSYDSATSSYGPVIAKETLWSIATKVRPGPETSMDQVILALSKANPDHITRGTTVNKGAVLRIPTASQMQSVSAAEAKSQLADLRRGGPARAAPKPQPASQPAVASAAPAETPPPPPAPPAEAKPEAPVIASTPEEAQPPAAKADAEPEPTVETPPAAAADEATAAAPAEAAEAPEASPATAPQPKKAPLAQPLAPEAGPGFIEEYGMLLGRLALLLLLAGAVFVFWRRRKAAVQEPDLAQFKPGDTASVVPPAGTSRSTAKLGDTTKLSGTQALGSAAVAAATEQGVEATQQVAAPAVAHESTVILDPELVASLNAAAKPAQPAKSQADFDKTTQLQVDTQHINLGDNDPISEADFHLAYGLYDEAILLLQGAIKAEPQRSDLQIKLAETYFAAGKPMEFQELAEELENQVSPADWSKILIMGAQICPDVTLFKSNDANALSTDFDLDFDEPAEAAPAAEPVQGLAAAPEPSASGSPHTAQDREDFGSDEPLNLDDNGSIDFMLEQSLTPLGAGIQLPPDKKLEFNLDSPELKLDIPKMEGDGSATMPDSSKESAFAELSENPTLTPEGTSPFGLSLQDLDVSITPRQPTAESVEDELNTKLDLARAYVEMGDNDMARGLLQEVQAQGNERHKQEAASLLQRLPA